MSMSIKEVSADCLLEGVQRVCQCRQQVSRVVKGEEGGQTMQEAHKRFV